MASVHLSAPLIFQFFNNAGQPNAGGSVLTQVGGVNFATYQDSAGSIALPNPIPLNARGEISNAAGTACQLFLVDGNIYTLTLYDANSNQLDSFTYVVGTSTSADIANLQSQITAFATSITTGTLTVTGSTTLGALSVGAITGTGAINIGSNTLTCGAVTCGAVTSTGNMSVTGNITATGTVTAAGFSSSAAAPSWAMNNASLRSSNGIINYQTQGQLNGNTYASGTITIGTGNTGNYLIIASAEVGYNGGVSGANATIEIYKNGSSTGFKSSWVENNNTTEHGTISIAAIINCASATDTIGVQFSTTSNGSCFAGSGTFVGKLL